MIYEINWQGNDLQWSCLKIYTKQNANLLPTHNLVVYAIYIGHNIVTVNDHHTTSPLLLNYYSLIKINFELSPVVKLFYCKSYYLCSIKAKLLALQHIFFPCLWTVVSDIKHSFSLKQQICIRLHFIKENELF